LYYEKTGLPLVTLLINQLQLTNEYAKSIVQNGGRDNNPLFVFAVNFLSTIWFEYNDITELEGIIQAQVKN